MILVVGMPIITISQQALRKKYFCNRSVTVCNRIDILGKMVYNTIQYDIVRLYVQNNTGDKKLEETNISSNYSGNNGCSRVFGSDLCG